MTFTAEFASPEALSAQSTRHLELPELQLPRFLLARAMLNLLMFGAAVCCMTEITKRGGVHPVQHFASIRIVFVA